MKWWLCITIIHVVTCKFSLGQSVTSILFNRDHFNKRLLNYGLQNASESSLTTCIRKCMVTYHCKSINSQRSTDICELNWADSTDVGDGSLTPNNDWDFVDMQTLPAEITGHCTENLCPSANMCVNDIAGPFCHPENSFTDCEVSENNVSGTIMNPHFPHGFPTSRCSWKLTLSDGERLIFEFVNASLGTNDSCSHTYVTVGRTPDKKVSPECQTCSIKTKRRFTKLLTQNICVYDGESTDYPVIETVCGNPEVTQRIISTGTSVLVTMDAVMSVTSAGFKALFEADCNRTYAGNTGSIESSSFSSFSIQSICNWAITVKPGHVVVLGFSALNLGTTSCETGFVKLYDGQDDSSGLINTICDDTNATKGFKKSTDNNMFVEIPVTVAGNDFSATFFSGYEETSTILGTIQSPNYPGNYISFLNEIWLLTVPEGHLVVLTFTDLVLEADDVCSFDRVNLYDGPSISYVVIANLCGYSSERQPSVYYTSGRYMTVQMTTDQLINTRGFQANYMPSCSSSCTVSTGTILSTNFPLPYPNNEDRFWTITLPLGYSVLLDLVNVGMEVSTGCTKDVVKVYEDENEPAVLSFCEMTVPSFYCPKGNSVIIKLQSDSSTTSMGFRMNYMTVLSC